MGNNKTTSLWKYFSLICSIPHPSGEEQNLCDELAKLGKKHNCEVLIDKTGNIKITRPPSPGYENKPHIIMQAHLDMVPQCTPESKFNFSTMPITPIISGDYVVADGGTTLGADNGIGLAGALAIVFDEEIKAGKLSILGTVEEETGLTGASNLSLQMLEGDILLNLDSESEGHVYIGCAGGNRLDGKIPLKKVMPPTDYILVEINVKGMKGGHSGLEINDNRGNAIKVALELLKNKQDYYIAHMEGGTLDNVIPRDCSVLISISPHSLEELKKEASALAKHLRNTLNVLPDFEIKVQKSSKSTKQVYANTPIAFINAIPTGVISMNKELNIVQTSNNLAAVEINKDKLFIKTHQRSSKNEERKKLTESIIELIKKQNGTSSSSSNYPGWDPQPNSELIEQAQNSYNSLFNKAPEFKVIHAGLECGIFITKNPNLQIISFGPDIENPHSPSERVHIKSVDKFYAFLKQLIIDINHNV